MSCLEKLKFYSKKFKKLNCQIIFIFFLFQFAYGEADLTITVKKSDKQSLAEFFHALLWGSEVGYVLYGEKPICIEPYITTFDITGKIMHHLSTSIFDGVRVWKQLSLLRESSKFIFILKENLSKGEELHSYVIFINKDAFRKAFSDNSSLFRYVLGPEVTANKLLQEMKNTEQDLFSFLRNDKVLIGILLGFGVENSLYVGRSEQIQEALSSHGISKKPSSHINFVRNKKFILPFEYSPIPPSLGYLSLANELDVINNKIDIASVALESYSPKLIFGRAINRHDASLQTLINNYQDTQVKILNVFDNPQWLEQILSQFYGEQVKILLKEDIQEDHLYNTSIDLSHIVAQAIFNRFNDEFEDKNKLSEFIEGMKEAEKRRDAHYIAPFSQREKCSLSSDDPAFLTGFKIWSYYKFNKIISLSSIIYHLEAMDKKDSTSLAALNIQSQILPCVHKQIFENINQHEQNLALSHFQRIEKVENSSVKCLVKNYLYYQQIFPGNGKPITKDQIIQVSYTLKTIYGNVIDDHSTGSILDLSRTIKAFRMSFPLMRVGEKGILFISPEWGIKDYLSHPHFSPYLIAEFTINEEILPP
jgi:FKBP-type peptidyl-prolyl cis-trans isomerase